MRTRKAKDRSRLIQAAMGQIPCDLTIGNVQFFNVITGEIYPASVDILDGFVVLVRAPASNAFSTSSLTTEAGRSTTSPAAIRSA